MHHTPVGSVHWFQFVRRTTVLHSLHPLLGSLCQAIGALPLIFGNIDVYPCDREVLVLECITDNKLQRAHCLAALTDQEAVEMRTWDVQFYDLSVFAGCVDVGIEPEKRQQIL